MGRQVLAGVFLVLLGVSYPRTSSAQSGLYDLYLFAHADDWPLFESPNLPVDIAGGDRVILVMLTAGDAGLTNGYWQAREEGLKAAIRFLVGKSDKKEKEVLRSAVLDPLPTSWAFRVWTYDRVSVVFMRLPDGGGEGESACGGNGNGTPTFGCQSLSQLRNSGKPLTAVDGSATYPSWQVLIGVVKLAITVAAKGETIPNTSNTWLNAPEFDRSLNPGDHPDHLAVGDLAKAIADQVPWSRAWFVGYDIVSRPENVDPIEAARKKGMYSAYFYRVLTLYGSTPTELDPGDPTMELDYRRQYVRAEY